MANERKTARREKGKSCKHIYRYLSSAQYPARFLKNRFTYQNVKGAVLEGFTCSTCFLDTARTTRSHWLSVEVNSQNWPINFFLDPLSPPSWKLPWILAIFFSRAAIERGRDVSNVSGNSFQVTYSMHIRGTVKLAAHVSLLYVRNISETIGICGSIILLTFRSTISLIRT